MSQGILVFIEQRNGQVRKASVEALSEARRQADRVGGPVFAVIVGEGITDLAGNAAKFGADRVLVVDNSAYSKYSSEGYAEALVEAIKRVDPQYVFSAHTSMSKDFLPRVAARLDSPCVSDAVELHNEGGAIAAVHPMYSGKVWAVYQFQAPLAFITLRANVFPALEPDTSRQAESETLAVTPAKVRALVTETHQAGGAKIELSEARVIVSGGRGIKGPENWPVLQKLCDTLGAALGASRAVVDAGWIDHQHQVGQTGKTVSPQLYIAVGISGAIQHLAGMSSSKVIVAINNNPEAPIFKNATYGVVGDFAQILPAFTEECKKMLAEV